MRYDSDPHIVKRVLTEADGLQNTLNMLLMQEAIVSGDFDTSMPPINSLLNTLDHFIQLHTFNPQFSLSRFSAHYIEKKLSFLKDSISKILRQKKFPSIEEQVKWNIQRFVHPNPTQVDNEQILISLYKRLVQVLETYYVDKVRDTHTAAVLNEFVGWVEHIDTHGHHDIHGVIIFAEKVTRDNAVIQHRVEVVRDICLFIQERSPLLASQGASEDRELVIRTAFELSYVYSGYLLQLYEALLEDMEIIVISNQDYHAFEVYCQDNDIDIYEEYHDVLKEHFKEYVEIISIEISSLLELMRTANIIVNAELTYKRYADREVPEEVIGENLSQDIRMLEHAIHKIRPVFADISEQYADTLQKIKDFKGELIKPAIMVYGEYMRSPKDFFNKFSTRLSEWIPILDSALACLEQDDDLYKKCHQLKQKIDEFMAGH
ncbi:MAG: hypothetical protein GY801_43310 [bacterium]|nr:hypothetical protein [bacterium]